MLCNHVECYGLLVPGFQLTLPTYSLEFLVSFKPAKR